MHSDPYASITKQILILMEARPKFKQKYKTWREIDFRFDLRIRKAQLVTRRFGYRWDPILLTGLNGPLYYSLNTFWPFYSPQSGQDFDRVIMPYAIPHWINARNSSSFLVPNHSDPLRWSEEWRSYFFVAQFFGAVHCRIWSSREVRFDQNL